MFKKKKKIKPVHPKGNQSWKFTGRTDAEAETPIIWPPDGKNWLIGKDPDAGKDWRQENGTTEDETVGWHHGLDRHEFQQAPGAGDGQGDLECCNPRGRRVGHDWATDLNWKNTKTKRHSPCFWATHAPVRKGRINRQWQYLVTAAKRAKHKRLWESAGFDGSEPKSEDVRAQLQKREPFKSSLGPRAWKGEEEGTGHTKRAGRDPPDLQSGAVRGSSGLPEREHAARLARAPREARTPLPLRDQCPKSPTPVAETGTRQGQVTSDS